MTKRVAMTRKEIKLALSVICPRCGVWTDKQCKNTETGKKKNVPHEARLKMAMAPTRSQVEVKSPVRKSPIDVLGKDQKVIVEKILEKVHALQHHAEFVGPVSEGPIVTTYRFLPQRATRVGTLEAMAPDFAVALGDLTGAERVLVKRMLGESAVGIFVPNKERKWINFRDTIQHLVAYMKQHDRPSNPVIPLNFGQDQVGAPVVENLLLLPHLLMAGSTMSGKSTLQHSLAVGLVWVKSSQDLKLIISDTKGVEFKQFASLPHLKFPIAKDVYETMQQLQWCIAETESRLKLIGGAGARNIQEFNKNARLELRMPYIVVLIDELADIMGPGVDNSEAKLNSKKLSAIVARARATGIHVIAGTQRPDVKIVGGTIKANFPARISFRLPSPVDSRTIINTKGAENLMSRGDMLYYSPNVSELRRLHAPYTSQDDVLAAVQYVVQREEMAKHHGTSTSPNQNVISVQ